MIYSILFVCCMVVNGRKLKLQSEEESGRNSCRMHAYMRIWEFPKIRVPYFGVLIIRILLFRVLY